MRLTVAARERAAVPVAAREERADLDRMMAVMAAVEVRRGRPRDPVLNQSLARSLALNQSLARNRVRMIAIRDRARTVERVNTRMRA